MKQAYDQADRKLPYEPVELEIIRFDARDVIATSGLLGDTEGYNVWPPKP